MPVRPIARPGCRATYAERSPSCPSCGLALDKGMSGPEAAEEHSRRGG